MKYFIPDWDDYLDGDFDFSRDKLSAPKHSERTNDIYAHELFGEVRLYDGILLSLAHITAKKGNLNGQRIAGRRQVNVRDSLRLPKHLPLLGDCGAFTYFMLDEPNITPAQAARSYERFGFEYGVSVDHLVIPGKLDQDQIKSRISITRSNAEEFYAESRVKDRAFIPYGSIQGALPQDFVECFNDYLDMGYDHVALGGLVPRSDDEILEILEAVNGARLKRSRVEQKRLHIHLFGILRPKIVGRLPARGVTSFDSASYLRKAWLLSGKNYLSPVLDHGAEVWYAAVRVPIADDKLIREGAKLNLKRDDILRMEHEALKALRLYSRRRQGLESTLNTVLEYDQLFIRLYEKTEMMRSAYERTLSSRVWERCRCRVCRDIGIHALIFRGFNRNKRRGFHNTYIFYRRLRRQCLALHHNGDSCDT